MIGYLEGVLRGDSLEEALIVTGGVGYSVRVSLATRAVFPSPGGEVQLWIHTHVREDELQLFGFAQETERTLFRMLIGISGIGPALALDVLGAAPMEMLVGAVLSEDINTLKGIKGVGPSKARRLLDLKPKLEKLGPGALAGTTGGAKALTPMNANRAPQPASAEPSVLGETLAALESLGYPRAQVYRSASEIIAEAGDSLGAGEVLKKVLQRIGRDQAGKRDAG